MANMGMLDFYIRVVKALDEIGAPYMIVGAFGGTIFGITRATHDIDIAEEAGITPEPIFKEIAYVSSNKSKKYSPMKDAMNNAGKTKFAHERRKHGKFVGMF
jgi:hypothetical protein